MDLLDLNDTNFSKEIQKISNDVNFLFNRLKQIGEFKINPNLQNTHFALEIKKVWDYAKGIGTKPAHLKEITENLYEILWRPVAGTRYIIPKTWWNEDPLGYACRAAEVRAKMESNQNLSTEEFSMLSGVTQRWVKQLCKEGKLKAEKVPRKKSGGEEWSIPAEECLKFLKDQN